MKEIIQYIMMSWMYFRYLGKKQKVLDYVLKISKYLNKHDEDRVFEETKDIRKRLHDVCILEASHIALMKEGVSNEKNN